MKQKSILLILISFFINNCSLKSTETLDVDSVVVASCELLKDRMEWKTLDKIATICKKINCSEIKDLYLVTSKEWRRLINWTAELAEKPLPLMSTEFDYLRQEFCNVCWYVHDFKESDKLPLVFNVFHLPLIEIYKGLVFIERNLFTEIPFITMYSFPHLIEVLNCIKALDYQNIFRTCIKKILHRCKEIHQAIIMLQPKPPRERHQEAPSVSQVVEAKALAPRTVTFPPSLIRHEPSIGSLGADSLTSPRTTTTPRRVASSSYPDVSSYATPVESTTWSTSSPNDLAFDQKAPAPLTLDALASPRLSVTPSRIVASACPSPQDPSSVQKMAPHTSTTWSTTSPNHPDFRGEE